MRLVWMVMTQPQEYRAGDNKIHFSYTASRYWKNAMESYIASPLSNKAEKNVYFNKNS